MIDEPLPNGPDLDTMIGRIEERFPDAAVARVDSAVFFSLDEKHWPNFATVVWTDEHDEGAPSDLARPGVYRVNVGLGRERLEGLVGSDDDPDYAALDRFVPHPQYANQGWISILNPSDATASGTLMPLIEEAHERLVARRDRRGQTG